MSSDSDELVRTLTSALACAGNGHALPFDALPEPCAARSAARLSQPQMAFLAGMSTRDYRRWERQGDRAHGPAAVLLHVIMRHPNAVRRALKG